MFLLLLVLPAFSYYSSPPVDAVIEHNANMADELDDAYNPAIAKHSSTWIFPPNSSLDSSASMEVAGLTLTIDNSTSANDDLEVIIARGYEEGGLACLTDEGTLDPSCNCDHDYWEEFKSSHVYAKRCDLDNDKCMEYIHGTNVEYGGEVLFIFRNTTATEPIEGPNIVPVPGGMLAEMENASGTENLTAKLNATIKLIYEINDRKSIDNVSCVDDFFTLNVTFRFSEERNFTVEGRNKIFFLKAPVLREQWHMNNHFDVIVLSQSRLYLADTELNGQENCSFRTHYFDTVSDSYGLWTITMQPEDEVDFGKADFNGAPLSEYNHSYGYYYEFDCPYEGLGRNNLSLEVVDLYGRDAYYSEMITSRMLSYGGNKNELGAPIQSEVTRQSAAFKTDNLQMVKISAGMLGALLILAVAKRWLMKK